MASSQTVRARVSDDVVQQIKTLAIYRGLLLPDGKPNLSAATRLALEVGLVSLRLEQRRTDQSLVGKVRDIRRPQAPTRARITQDEVK